MENLHTKIVKGSIWNFSSKITVSASLFLKMIIVASIISPRDYGLLMIAVLTLNMVKTFTQTGFTESIIQKDKESRSYLNTAWTISILRGIISYGIIFLLTPIISFVFAESETENIIKILGLTILIQSFSNIGIILFEKELEFKNKFILDILSEAPGFIITLIFTLVYQNYWGWVVGALINSIIFVISSYILHFYRPKFEFNKAKFFVMFRFSKWVAINNIIVFMLIQGDDLLVGLVFGTTALGYYSLAYKISNFITTEITHTITRVSFPGFSKIQNQPNLLKNLYFKVFRITAVIVLPLSGLILILANNFTYTILGKTWLPVGPLIMILTFEAISRALSSTLGSLFQAIGRPKIITKVALVQLILFLFLIFTIGLEFGVFGVATIVSFSYFVSIPLFWIFGLRKIKLSIIKWFKSLTFPFFGTLFVCFLMFFFQMYFDYNLVNLILQGLISITLFLIYGLIISKFNLFQSRRIVDDLKNIKTILFFHNEDLVETKKKNPK